MGELILIAEDNEIVREVARTILEIEGYRVLVAADGQEGLSTFMKHSSEIDLVITDNNMPKMSGIHMIKGIREIKPDVKLLVTSGSNHNEVIESCLKLSVSNFLPKPYTPSALKAWVVAILGTRARVSGELKGLGDSVNNANVNP